MWMAMLMVLEMLMVISMLNNDTAADSIADSTSSSFLLCLQKPQQTKTGLFEKLQGGGQVIPLE